MSSRLFLKCMVGFYLLIFFGYLFGPLIIMTITAFNDSDYPQIYPFTGFTLRWFDKLFADRDIILGLKNALIIGVLVVMVSVPIGLAGAILMTQVYERARSFYYLVVVSPVLTPGVIIGISTVIFWRDMTNLTGARFMFDGFVMTVLGQSCYISAYCMLIFLSRLQRFDKSRGGSSPRPRRQLHASVLPHPAAVPAAGHLLSGGAERCCRRSRTTTRRRSPSCPTRRSRPCWPAACGRARRRRSARSRSSSSPSPWPAPSSTSCSSATKTGRRHNGCAAPPPRSGRP